MSSGRRSFLLGLLLIAATVCLVLGLTMPVIRLTRFYVWSDVHSLISIVWELYLWDEVFLAAVIFLFSIVFPFLKLVYLAALYAGLRAHPGYRSRWLKRVAWLGKWSMLDVLVLALLIFYVRAATLAEAVSMPGVYLFAAAVILTMLAHGMVEYEVEREEKRARDERGEQDPEGVWDAGPHWPKQEKTT